MMRRYDDPAHVTGAIFAQLEDLPLSKQIMVVRGVLRTLEAQREQTAAARSATRRKRRRR